MENYVAATAYYIVIGYNLASLLQEKSTINICDYENTNKLLYTLDD